jgi:hypothetical protein
MQNLTFKNLFFCKIISFRKENFQLSFKKRKLITRLLLGEANHTHPYLDLTVFDNNP